MATLFNANFSEGRIFGKPHGGFEHMSVTGGTFAVQSPGYGGSGYCAACTPYSGQRCSGEMFVRNPATFRQRFYFDPNSISFGGSANNLCIARNYHLDLSEVCFSIWLSKSGSQFYMDFGLTASDMSTMYSHGSFTIVDDWQRIEMLWTRGSPGSIQLWVDDVSKGTVSASNATAWLVAPGLGSLRHSPAIPTSGNPLLFDAWTANDDGGYIGPV